MGSFWQLPLAMYSKAKRSSLPGRQLLRPFFESPPEHVSPRLLGKILVHRTENEDGTKYIAGRIGEVEAYLGPHNTPPDPASHSHRGPTPRNVVMFGPPGYAYVYAIYGRYFCMNVTCEPPGLAGCILIRALEPLQGVSQMALNRSLQPGASPRQLTSGPGRLCLALGLTRPTHNALDLCDPASPLQIRDDGYPAPELIVTPRIGISAAVDWPLRFAVRGNPCVSGPRSMR